ncbi:YcxB family protein [Oceanobacillus neutriphilus]|uniref:YcxB-like C-terminal domain-containing protein n=1 Tax=Oceanobacillus neutriphilus TaxID=531815 RepID=A0ABQ2NNR0_9BACI|nr:hypothetical protein [Oceanobacillus neutriphilus]GGP07879.1 hypothetical protein GCM10011346_05890 [Oceanobacillus neutriphilus]
MIAEFKITDEDLIAQQKNAINNTKYYKRALVMTMLLVYILYFFVLIFAGFSMDTIIFSIILLLIISPIAWQVYKYIFLIRNKRVIKQRKNGMGVFTLTLSDNEFVKKSQNLTEKFRWDEINMFQEDSERYYLYLTDLIAITIKKKPDNMNEKEMLEYQAFIKNKANINK